MRCEVVAVGTELLLGQIVDTNSSWIGEQLALIGIDHVAGWFDHTVIESWRRSGGVVETVAQTTVAELAPRLAAGDVSVVDVRSRAEWDHGHIPGAMHIQLGHLVGRAGEIRSDRPVVLQCQGGARSAIATSLLQRLGVANVVNLRGGFAEWAAGGNPVSAD